MNRPRTIEIKLAGGRAADTPVPIEDTAKFLKQLQTLVNHIGDYLIGSDFRVGGHSPEFVRKKCSLVFNKVEMGSFNAELTLADAQVPLWQTEFSLGESSIQMLYDLIESVDVEEGLEERVEKLIQQPMHRTRIIGDMNRLWPSEDRYAFNVGLHQTTLLKLNPSRKPTLEGLLNRFRSEQVTSVRGVLSAIQLLPTSRKEIRVDGPDGRIICNLTKDQEEEAKNKMGKPVVVYGDAVFDADGNVKEITKIDKLLPFTDISLSHIISDEGELLLNSPVDISINFKDDVWVMNNDEIGILAVASLYDDAIQDFQEEFYMLWNEYGKSPDEELTGDAKKLKEKIRKYVKGA